MNMQAFGVMQAAYALPQAVSDVDAWCAAQGLPAEQADGLRAHGSSRYHPANPAAGDRLATLGLRAIDAMFERCEVARSDIDALVVCQTSPCTTLPAPHTLAGTLRQAAGLKRAVAFSVGQQHCVSPVHALRVLQALFAKHAHWRHALVISADIVLRESLRAIGTSGIHSDAASALLVGRHAAGRLAGIATYNDPVAVQGILPDGRYEPNDKYLWSLVSTIRQALKAAGTAASQLYSVIPHNVNLPAWEQALDALRIPRRSLFRDNFARIGHAFGSDAAINLADSHALRAGGRHLVFASGIGGCFGAFILDTEPA